MTTRWIAFLFCCLLACRAIDPGGVSLDFRKNIGNQPSSRGENLLAGGAFENEADFQLWQSSHWVHLAAEDGDFQTLHQQVKPFLQCEWKNGTACFVSDPQIGNFRNARGGPLMVSNRLARIVPVGGAGKYQLRFRLSGEFLPWNGFNGFRVAVHGIDADNLPLEKESVKIFSLSRELSELNLEFIAPGNTRAVSITFAMYGIGRAILDDVVLAKSTVKEGVTATLVPFAMLDNLFCLPEGLPLPILFGLRNESGTPARQANFYLRLPEGFRVLASRPDNPFVQLENQTWKVDLRSIQGAAPATSYSVSGAVVCLQVESDQPASGKMFSGQYWTEDGNWTSPVESFSLQVLKTQEAPRPKRFQSGFLLRNDLVFQGSGASSFVGFLNTTGFNCANYVPRDLALEMRKHQYGIYGEPIANGYRIGPNPKSPEALFRLADGSAFLTPRKTENICPCEVYQQGQYYREKVIPSFEKHLEVLDFFMCNWEPFMFDNKGCFCQRCREEFIQYARADPEAIKAIWNDQLLSSRWYDTWIKFRSWQHGKLVQTLDETLSALGEKHGRESGFIPMISYTCLLASSQHQQYDILDYMDKLKTIEPWGPYVYHRFSEPYQYFCGWNLITWLAAKKMQAFTITNTRYAAKHPNLIAMPHGYQGTDWVTEPELIALETLGFFLCRFAGSFAYFFPAGYDYRYWSAMAEANRVIADCEDLVLDGEEVTGQVLVSAQSGLPAANLPLATVAWNDYSAIPEAHNASLLQYRAYRNSQRMLVAVGNFWKYGDCFFTLRTEGLDSQKKYVVSDLLAKINYGEFTGSELESGILGHAGAVRWAFIEIRALPPEKDVGPIFTQSQMRASMAARLPLLKKQLDEEARLASSRFSANNDYSKVPALEAYGIKSGPVSSDDGKRFIAVETKQYSLLLDAENGGRLIRWTQGQTPLSGETGKFGIGIDAFMQPAFRMFDAPWQIAGGDVDLEGVKYTLFLKIPEVNEPVYGGLMLTKHLTFQANAVKIETIVENKGQQARDFVYRSHNMTAFLTTREGRVGQVRCGDIALKRNQTISLIEVKSGDPAVKKIYPAEVMQSGGNEQLLFSAPWTNTSLKGIFSPESLEFFAFWDSDVINSFASTEALYESQTLKPGEKCTFSVLWQIE
ncbi:MAG: hypothetical protein GX946_05585 [Oligosphaeraceae bacterium]|nr:hypothetical protein [Oligosphaeraceae bacterium]